MITVKITPTQSDKLYDLLPESLCDLTVLTTRVKGSKEDLKDALTFLDADTAIENWELGVLSDLSDVQREFAEKQIRACIKDLHRRISKAVS